MTTNGSDSRQKRPHEHRELSFPRLLWWLVAVVVAVPLSVVGIIYMVQLIATLTS